MAPPHHLCFPLLFYLSSTAAYDFDGRTSAWSCPVFWVFFVFFFPQFFNITILYLCSSWILTSRFAQDVHARRCKWAILVSSWPLLASPFASHWSVRCFHFHFVVSISLSSTRLYRWSGLAGVTWRTRTPASPAFTVNLWRPSPPFSHPRGLRLFRHSQEDDIVPELTRSIHPRERPDWEETISAMVG